MKKLFRVIVVAFVAAVLISGCMDDAMDKSKLPQKATETPSTTGK